MNICAYERIKVALIKIVSSIILHANQLNPLKAQRINKEMSPEVIDGLCVFIKYKCS
jgi:hypothetical protein